MLAGAVLISQMIDDIKVEARVKGSDNLNITIQNLITEELLAASERDRYSLQLVESSPIVAIAGQGKYPLPADFSNIKAVYYGRAAEGIAEGGRVLRHKNDFVERSRDGVEPKFYEIVGAQISLWPFGGILSTDLIAIDYWQFPNAVQLTDTFPIPKLYTTVKRKVVARVYIINKDLQAAALVDKASEEQEKAALTSEDNSDTE